MTLRFTDIRRRYGSTVALDGVTLDIGSGVTGLLGPNGAGKSTLMRMAATVQSPSSGCVRVCGLDPDDSQQRTAIRRQLGYVPQEPGFHPSFTVFEFIDYVAILKEMTDRRARHAEVRRVIELVDLGDRAGSRIRKLSGGMRRRVALAQALLGDPSLLLLDEPTAGLDPEQRFRFRELVTGLGADRTILLSTHQTDDVAALCERVVVMKAGVVRFDGRPLELAQQAHDRVWVDDGN
ncbi:MAG: ATP-binding cassette domain-containing protein, partial [Nitriliruptorales bacterium]|nr:ATP-binding cassette domain-containing protein [Nitriliruptorales bacterium]